TALVDEVDRAEHRAVAAERDGDVEAGGELLAPADEVVERPGFDVLGAHAHGQAVALQPGRGPPCQILGDRPVAVRDQPDGGDRPVRGHPPAPSSRAGPGAARASSSSNGIGAAPLRQWTRNSTFPSAPRSGERIAPTTAMPAAARPVATRRSTSACTA